VAVAVVAAVAGVLLTQADDDGDGGTASSPTSTTPSSVTEAEPEAAAEPATDAAPVGEGGVPEDWVEYEGDVGYTISHPPGWEARPGDGNQVNFTDPETGDYLRVDYVTPPGPDAVAAWEQYEPSFAARFADYQRIRIEPTEDGGAIWEYTYSGQRATNRAILTDDIGFALNFVADEDRWEDLADVREAFERSFHPPG
jgi:hypothetical protein